MFVFQECTTCLAMIEDWLGMYKVFAPTEGCYG